MWLFFDIYLNKTKEEVVKAANPMLYKRFTKYVINEKKKDQADLLFENLINHHP